MLQSNFEGTIAVNRNRETNYATGLAIDVMAAGYSKKGPTVFF